MKKSKNGEVIYLKQTVERKMVSLENTILIKQKKKYEISKENTNKNMDMDQLLERKFQKKQVSI